MTDVRKLSQPTMLAFGIGQAAEGMKNQAFAVFLVFYYQQVIGLPGWMAGLALAVALIFDAIMDPLAGLISDRTQSRWGRRHPFMLASAVPLFFAFIALFQPPDGMSDWAYFAWLTVFAILVRGALALYYVPHLALLPPLADARSHGDLILAAPGQAAARQTARRRTARVRSQPHPFLISS